MEQMGGPGSRSFAQTAFLREFLPPIAPEQWRPTPLQVAALSPHSNPGAVSPSLRRLGQHPWQPPSHYGRQRRAAPSLRQPQSATPMLPTAPKAANALLDGGWWRHFPCTRREQSEQYYVLSGGTAAPTASRQSAGLGHHKGEAVVKSKQAESRR